MAAKIVEIKDQLNKSLRDPSKPWTFLLDSLETKTGVNRLYIFVSGIAFVAVWLVFGFAAQLMCNGIGFIYPAYVSVHAIESPSKDDDTKWLTYWVVFALFSVVEFFADIIVGWFPLYWLTKCVFMVWLMIPTDLNGSLLIYRKLIRPYFLKHRGSIDATLNRVKDANESRFCVYNNDGHLCVYRRPNERHSHCNFFNTTLFGGGSVMVLAGISLTCFAIKLCFSGSKLLEKNK